MKSDDSSPTIYELVRYARHMTQQDLAKELGVSKQTISAIENKSAKASKLMQLGYSQVLGVSPELFEKFDSEENKCDSFEELLYKVLKIILRVHD